LLLYSSLFFFIQLAVSDTDPVIYGGTVANNGQFPFMVHLWEETQGYHFCGGSLIGPYHVLTAAHCLKGQDITKISVRSGTINYDNSPGDLVPAVSMKIHSSYSDATLKNDVGIIKLSRPFASSTNTRTIEMASGTVAAGTSVTVAGWGESETYYYTLDLLFTKAPVISNSACQAYGQDYATVSGASQICVFANGKDSCQGDSGGPLFTGAQTTALQHGIVSWGIGCGVYPGVYTRVSNFRGWINTQTSHSVSTACSNCVLNANWKALCESIGGVYDKTASAYLCKKVDVLKTRTVNKTWTGCSDTKTQDLCSKIGRYSCVSGKGKCQRL